LIVPQKSPGPVRASHAFHPVNRASRAAGEKSAKALKSRIRTQKRRPYPSGAPLAKSRVAGDGPLRPKGAPGDIEVREDNVKVFGLLVAGAALVASVGVAAAQDAAAGEKVFLSKCKICHMPPEAAKNLVGPSLAGVVGRKAGTVPGYHYSDANEKSGITWDEAELKKYLKDPKGVVPGTKMVFPGLQSEQDIDNVIAYLKQFGPDGKKI
jgi:cytochrome c